MTLTGARFGNSRPCLSGRVGQSGRFILSRIFECLSLTHVMPLFGQVVGESIVAVGFPDVLAAKLIARSDIVALAVLDADFPFLMPLLD